MCVIRSVRICIRFISCCMPFFFISTIYICKAQWFNDRINKETKKTMSLKYKMMKFCYSILQISIYINAICLSEQAAIKCSHLNGSLLIYI